MTRVFYVYMEALRERLDRRKGKKHEALAPVERTAARSAGH